MIQRLGNLFVNLRTDAHLRKRALWAGVGLAVLAVLAFDSFPAPQAAANSSSWTPQAAVSAPSTIHSVASIDTGFIWVDVAGQVKHPGVYRLKPGDRVFSLVFLAGGFLKNAQQASVNLARPLTDGEQVIVAAKQSTSGSSNQIDTASPASGGASTSKVNVNSADEKGLEQLPGVGPTLGQRIADYRAKHGPFKSKADLLNVPGIGPKLVAGMTDFVAY